MGTSFEDEAERREFRAASLAAWDALVELSTDGRGPVVIEGANHSSMVRDDAYWGRLVEAVREVVEAARAKAESSRGAAG